MTFGERLVFAREKKGLKQNQLAEIIGITPTRLNYWEKDKREPDVKMIWKLINALGVPGDWLIGSEVENKICSLQEFIPYSEQEQTHIQKYRQLPELGRALVNSMVDSMLDKDATIWEYDDLIRRQKKDAPITLVDNRRESHIYWSPASAGAGAFLDSPEYDAVLVGPDVPKSAAFGVMIRGDSMEPDYPDGHIAWVQMCPNVEIGQIGVFRYQDEVYIKKMGDQELISLNSDYAPIQISQEDGASVYGRVVACTPDEFERV